MQLDRFLRKEAVEGIERLMRRRWLTVVVARKRERGAVAGTGAEPRRTSVRLTDAWWRSKPAQRHRRIYRYIIERKRVEHEPARQTWLNWGSRLKSVWDRLVKLVARLTRHFFISARDWRRNRARVDVAVSKKIFADRALSRIQIWRRRFAVCRRRFDWSLWLFVCLWLHLPFAVTFFAVLWLMLMLICDWLRLYLRVIFEKRRVLIVIVIGRRLAGPTVWTTVWMTVARVVLGGIDEISWRGVARRRARSRLRVWLWWFARIAAFVAIFLVRRVPRIFHVFFDGFFALFWRETFDFFKKYCDNWILATCLTKKQAETGFSAQNLDRLLENVVWQANFRQEKRTVF